ncbi:nitroreductase family protein [Chromobacterium sp. IIBBL 290-4]|uniref:nitroreductase family protein n=1 Tax=Chromobacterium sp. IIBBL 290-4 TaxID=2953890 RepID=UPI0020B8D335|nr:nitroreductase family protein [Chromobacterium sp. IIBBL 290-4]UTH72936.1 nitroreductase family protein [Chromobacterium sp. IIBBL 290-4]
MKTALQALLEARISANHFDASHGMERGEVERLIQLATLAPSAYHMQNWRFIAVQSAEAKARLLPLAFGQRKVAEAAVTFICCGVLGGHRDLPQRLQPAVDAGVMPGSISDAWIRAAASGHEGKPQTQRDEAVRSVSLAAMSLMLAAQEQGLASCPMGGFDAAGVARAFGLPENEIPVLLLPVGRAAEGNWAQKPRRPVAEVLELV